MTALEGIDAAFRAAYPGYAETGLLDELRASEYGYLDSGRHVYLDYTGASLPAVRQLRLHANRVLGGCFGNPHSENPTSQASTALVERTRAAILKYFRASPDEYAVIFTPNATGACRLVGEAYPFRPGTRLVLTQDNHNSVNGIRRFARARHATVDCVPLRAADLRVDEEIMRAHLGRRGWRELSCSARRRGGRGLFGYPAQSNFTGVQHPLTWIELAHRHGYDVLLDAAAFVPTNRLDLSAVRPDFVVVSWYKLVGFPTGVGSLIARREALARLRRPWFSGGTVTAVSALADWHLLARDESAFEDGTLNFLDIPAVQTGLEWIQEIGIDLIHRRVSCLTGWLLQRLAALRHRNGRPMIRLYGPTGTRGRGGIVTFNILDSTGQVVDERVVNQDACRHGISLRTGCFCNPGAAEAASGLTRRRILRSLVGPDAVLDDYIARLGLPSGGAIRVSVGPVSTVEDIEHFVRFAEGTYRGRASRPAGLPTRERC